MASPNYTALTYTTIFTDGSQGVGGTGLNASTFTTRSNDLANAINNHTNGLNQAGAAGNQHPTMDILDYNSANVGAPYQLLETTAYTNTATTSGNANTTWQRLDMFAFLDKAFIGGVGTLTTRYTAWAALSDAGGGATLTNMWNLTHGGSPTFGSIVAVANDNTHAAVQGRAPSGDPASGFLLRLSNNAGAVDKAYVDYSGLGAFFGGVAGIAPSTILPAVRALSIDNVARNVVSLRFNNNTENGSLWSDGSAILTQVTMNGVAAPALSATGKSSIYTDTSGVVHVSQNGGAYVGLVGAAAASGSAGAVQVAGAGNTFTNDVNDFFYDTTNHRLGLALGASPTVGTTLDVNGAFTLRGIAIAGVASAGTGILAFDSAANVLKVSQNGNPFTQLIVGNNGGNQTITIPSGSFLTIAGNMQVNGQMSQGQAGANYGAVTTAGTGNGFTFFDRGGSANAAVWYRDSANAKLLTSDSGNLDLLLMSVSTGALTTKSIAATTPAIGTIPGVFATIAGQTADAFRIDASVGSTTNGIIEKWDFAGRRYQAQGTAPAIVAGAGAGGTPTVVTVTGTDYEGTIAITTGGTAPTGSNALIATITFRNAFGVAPKAVQITPASTNAGNLTGTSTVFAGVPSTTAWNLSSGSVALANSTAYVFAYRLLV